MIHGNKPTLSHTVNYVCKPCGAGVKTVVIQWQTVLLGELITPTFIPLTEICPLRKQQDLKKSMQTEM